MITPVSRYLGQNGNSVCPSEDQLFQLWTFLIVVNEDNPR